MGWSVKQCLRIALRNMKGRQLFLVYDGGLAANLLTHCMFMYLSCILMRFFFTLIYRDMEYLQEWCHRSAFI